MNPYYQPGYANNTPNYQYGVNNYAMPLARPVLGIESMYSNVQPYSSKQFLVTTFGNKLEYIQIFLTLAHEDKLKMYMLMQQKKYYGKITDQASYQRILRLIAEKMRGGGTYPNLKEEKRLSSPQKKEKELENKINEICQITFQKLKITTFHKDVQKWEEDFGQFEESEQTDGQWEEQTRSNGFSSQGDSPRKSQKSGKGATDNYVGYLNNQRANAPPTVPTVNAPVFSMLTFDPQMERALTNQIGLKKEEEKKVSIWELKIDQSQLKRDEPNIRQVFNSKKQEPVQYQFTRNKNESNDNGGLEYFKVYSLDTNQKDSPTLQAKVQEVKTVVKQQHDLLDFGFTEEPLKGIAQLENSPPKNDFGFSFQNIRQEASNTDHNQHNILDFNFPDFTTQKVDLVSDNLAKSMPIILTSDNEFFNMLDVQSAYQTQKIIPMQVQTNVEIIQNKQTEEQDQEWEEAQAGEASLQLDSVTQPVENSETDWTKEASKQFVFQQNQQSQPSQPVNLQQLYPSKAVQQNHQQNIPFSNAQTIQLASNLFDFNAMQISHSAAVPEINPFLLSPHEPSLAQQTANIKYEGSTAFSSPQFTPQSQVQLSPKLAPLLPPPIISMNAQNQQSNIRNSQLFIADDDNRYHFLNRLKVELKPEDLQQVQKQLKNKSFECNWDFYSIIIDYLKELSLQNSHYYQHFTEQFNVAKQIHELTEKYSQVVNEDEQDIVFATIRQSKQLYNQIYNKSQLSEQYVESLLSVKSKQKGFLYKFAQILVDSNIKRETMERAINQQSRKNVEDSLYVIYTLEKMNGLKTLKDNAERIVKFLNDQYERYKNLEEQLLQRIQRQTEKYPKYLVYIRGILRVCMICERMIQLTKICFIKIQANVVKTLKICKQFKGKYPMYAQKEQSQILPNDYTETLKQGVSKNWSIYDLHAQFLQAVERNPVCCFCLQEIRRWGGENSVKGWIHYSCYNLNKQMLTVGQY